MFIYRDVVYNKECENPHIAEVILGKNRHGATGTVETHFEGRFTRFRTCRNVATARRVVTSERRGGMPKECALPRALSVVAIDISVLMSPVNRQRPWDR